MLRIRGISEPTELWRVCGTTSEVKLGGVNGKSNGSGCSVEMASDPGDCAVIRERLLGTGRRSDKSNGDSSVELAPDILYEVVVHWFLVKSVESCTDSRDF